LKILVTGASGYLGARISEYLSLQGHQVIALVRKIPEDTSWQEQMSGFVVGNIKNESTIQELAIQQVDAVIYTISLNQKDSESDIGETLETNVTSMWKLLDRLSQQNLERFIYLSTQQVYGKLPPQVIYEQSPLNPQNNYGLTHLMCENIIHLFNQRSRTKCVSVRLSNGYGAPRFQECDCWWLVINDFCKSAFEKGKIDLISDGTPQRDFVHINDICQALELLLQADVSSLKYSSYNLGSGQTSTMLELAHVVANVSQQKFHKSIPVLFSEENISKNAEHHENISRFKYDLQKISSLSYQSKVDLGTGVSEIFDFLQSTST